MRVGILTEYPSPAVQSGPAIHTRFLSEGLERRGHDVVLMGPDTTGDAPVEGIETHLYRSFGYPTHPKVKVAMPVRPGHLWNAPDVDVIHSQTNTHMVHYANWMREMRQVPVLNTHTIHLPTHCHFLVSDSLWRKPAVKRILRDNAEAMERNFANMYNMGDALIVQNRFYVDYWRERGVTVPIHVVGRPIDPSKFSAQPGPDPYPRHFRAGKRLLVVCRHDREKSLDHLIRIFQREIAPSDPEVTLTLVGDGHDHANLVAQAERGPHADRIHFPGESSHDTLVDWYAHGDIFVYTSVSETFGNVVNEALWCGLPVVGLDDRMGVAHQLADGVNGFLVQPNRGDTDQRFAAAALRLVRSETLRQKMGEEGANLSRCSSHPDVVLRRFELIYGEARDHARRAVPVPLSERSRLAQARRFAFHMSRWAWWNGLLLSIAHTATRLGAARQAEASQHEAVTRQRTERRIPMAQEQRSAA
ncbi:MAG: glycosyltransferase [Myxococcota bacterium]